MDPIIICLNLLNVQGEPSNNGSLYTYLSLIGITYGSIHYILYVGNFGTEKKMSNSHNV
jgi:hypothetical protein